MRTSPSGWADALLRLFLKPDVFASVSGDLLEQYRDSILPDRGKRRADGWYVTQVLGFVLREARVWAALFAGAFVARTALDWLRPTTDFLTRSEVSTALAVAILLTAGSWTAWRSCSFAAGAAVGLATTALAAILSAVGTLIALAIWHDAQTMAAITGSGGLEEALSLPALLILPGVAVGGVGGLLGATTKRLVPPGSGDFFHRSVENLHSVDVTWLERGLLFAVVLTLALLLFGWVLVPTAVPFAPVAVLIAYGVVARFGARTIHRGNIKAPRVTIIFGGLGAAVLVPSLLVQYAGRTVNNLVMMGIVFVLWFLAGLITARLTGRVMGGVLSSTLSAMISSLANVIGLLASYYILRGSALQERFFRIEGDYEDFARSGMADFSTWVMGDLFGGTFLHLLLGAIIGGLLGTLAGIAMTLVARFTSRAR